MNSHPNESGARTKLEFKLIDYIRYLPMAIATATWKRSYNMRRRGKKILNYIGVKL